MDKAIKAGHSPSTLKALATKCLDGDKKAEAELVKKIFKSPEEGIIYIEKYMSARKSLFDKYPELFLINDAKSCTNCDISGLNRFFDNFDKIINLKANTPTERLTFRDEVPTCGSYWRQVKLLACATGCSFAPGGLGVVLCGWGCWCMLCNEESDLADIIY